MRDSTVLPILRMLPSSRLRPHEEHDPRRLERLCNRLRKEALLKNPPVVAEIPGTELFVVLDGANRALAFQAMGISHIVAQVVSYTEPSVILDTWYHVVSGMKILEFERVLSQSASFVLENSNLEAARQLLASRQASAYIVRADGVRVVRSPHGSADRQAQLLHDLVELYKGKADIHRASNDVWEKQAPYYPHITALVIFPPLTSADILHAAQSGEYVPTGITRHIINNRAVNINIPLSILEADLPQETKDAWLNDWLMERMEANAIRYYSESTFSFNE